LSCYSRLFDTAINMSSSVYVSYSLKQMHMDAGANLFIYLVLNKVSCTVPASHMQEVDFQKLSIMSLLSF